MARHSSIIAHVVLFMCAALGMLSLQAQARTIESSPDAPFHIQSRSHSPSALERVLYPSVGQPSKNAYCTFLTPGEPEPGTKTEEDHYFIGVRMLIYQLLHDPATRSNTSIPFVVLVSKDVPQWQRDRLLKDGAHVLEVEPLDFGWVKPGRKRWARVMDKLHIFTLTQFDKVLLLDTDVVVARRLDGVFADPATETLANRGQPDRIAADEASQPTQYMFAANSGPYNPIHVYPTRRGGKINAGFVVVRPDLAMFQHYKSVAAIKDRFNPSSPEQNLMNYIHRRDGNMPWTQLDPDWTTNCPNDSDLQGGVASFHEKYWTYSKDKNLRDMMWRSRWNMEGFWEAAEHLSG